MGEGVGGVVGYLAKKGGQRRGAGWGRKGWDVLDRDLGG